MAERRGVSFWAKAAVRVLMVTWLMAGSVMYAVTIKSAVLLVVTAVVSALLTVQLIYRSDFFIKRRRTAADVVRDRLNFERDYGPEFLKVT
jgi:hypothetical protein